VILQQAQRDSSFKEQVMSHTKSYRWRRVAQPLSRSRVRLSIDSLEDRNLLSSGQWQAVFQGLSPAATRPQQTINGQNLLHLSGITDQQVQLVDSFDLSGTFLLQTSTAVEEAQLQAELHAVPGFVFVQEFPPEEDDVHFDQDEKNAETAEDLINRDAAPEFNYEQFLTQEKNGQIPFQGGAVPGVGSNDILVNNNAGNGGSNGFTHSETSILAFGTHVVIAYNDSGSFQNGATNKFTGWSFSDDGGLTFTDGGVLPTNAGGDAGDPSLARDNVTGRLYLATLGFDVSTDQVFHSDDNGHTWSLPVNGTPGGSSEDKEWITVDNFAGSGQGNVYMISRNFGGGNGIFLYRSTDQGNTFGPSGGTLITSGMQGAFVAVGPDHSVYVFWYNGTTIMMRKSIDQGVSFGAPVTVASGLVGGTNGDLGLTGIRNGTATPSGFRSSEFPHAAINPVSGNVYVVFDNKGAGTDKGDVFIAQSTDGGATFGAPIKVNDDVTTTDQWQPTLAVSPDGSRVGVFYYSRQEDAAGNNLFKYYGRIAAVSGPSISFLPSFAISDTASQPEFGRDAVVNSVYMGDYNFAAATPGFFHVAWSDNRFDVVGGAPAKEPDVFYKAIPLGLVVSSTNPPVGSVISTQPTSFVVTTSDPVQAGSLSGSDFLVNGIPANAFTYTPGTNTITFTFNSTPVTVQGVQTMHINAGAILRDPDGSPILAFDGTFRYDVTPLQVTSTVPPTPGGVFTLPAPLTYDVNFNEVIDPSSVQTSDLMLSGIPGAFVSGVTVLPGNTTAEFTISGLTTEGVLTATIPAGAITDQFGNPGFGNPAAPFTANYEVDYGTVAYPTPLATKNPIGSLVYDPSVAGRVNFAGDLDNFTINVDGGQTISLLVTPTQATLQPTITLRDPGGNIVATATAAAANQNALVQTIAVPATGIYTITVSGAGGTIGNYNLNLTLNAALENEGLIVGTSDNTLGTAQNLDPSFTALQVNLASGARAAVQAVTDNASYNAAAVPFTFEDISLTGTVISALSNQDDTAASVNIGFNFSLFGTTYTSVFVTSNGLMTFGAANTGFTNADLTTTPAQAAISPFWDDLHTGGGGLFSGVFQQVSGSGANQHLTVQWNQVRFFSGGTAGDTITFEAQLFADGRIQFNYPDLVSGAAAGNNGASATVGLKDVGTQGANRLLLAFNNGPNAFVGTGLSTLISPPVTTPDYYSFSLTAGQTTTVALTGSGTYILQLRDSGDNVVATGVGGATNVNSMISNFVAPSSGNYFVRVTSLNSLTPYNLLVTKNAAFDTETNDSFATAQNVTGVQGVLGAIVPGASTLYTATPVTFGFDDISGTGTAIAALDGQDDNTASIPIGFTFNFYNTNYTSVFVSSNGLMTFGGGDASFGNADMTLSPALAGIAPFWDDLIVSGSANSHVLFQVLGSGSTQRLVVQWNQISFFSGGTAGDTITFEAELFADGSIRFNYPDLVSGAAGGNNGASATVGIKDAGTQGANRLLLAFNNGPNAFVGTGQSTLATLPPPEDWYSFNVPSTTSQIILQTSTPGDGPGEPNVLLNPHIELYDPSNNLIASGITLADGRNEIIKLHSSPVAGVYRMRVTAEGGTSGSYFIATLVRSVARGGPLSPTNKDALLGDPGTGSAVAQAVLPKSDFVPVPIAKGKVDTVTPVGAVQVQTKTPAAVSLIQTRTAVDDQALPYFLSQQAKPTSLDDVAVSLALVDILNSRKG
jgi:hypothetical protein